MATRWRPRAQTVRLTVCTVVTLAAGMVVAFPQASNADVTAVKGSAYGYRAFNLNLFGMQPDVGPTPIVTLAPDASNSPQHATAATGGVVADVATLFTSGAITVDTA